MVLIATHWFAGKRWSEEDLNLKKGQKTGESQIESKGVIKSRKRFLHTLIHLATILKKNSKFSTM
jgi:hypothetical protein